MGPSSALYKAILQPSFFGFGGVREGHSPSFSMAGVQGRSGGRRPGAGRRPSATQIKVPKPKGIKKPSKPQDSSLPDVSTKKLTAFFAPTPAAAAAATPKM
jgi:hypothetical protein